jgi:hypothetical protein
MKLLAKYSISFCFFIISVLAYSQEKNPKQNNVTLDPEEYKNPALGPKPRILIVPYPQHLFFASGEHYICTRSKLNRGQLNEKFRRSLDATLNSGLSLYYYTKNLMVRSAKSGYDPQTDVIHKIFQFQDERQLMIAHYKAYPSKTLTKIFKSDAKTYGSNCVNKGGNRPRTLYKDFRKPILKNDSLLQKVLLDNECNMLLLMTQFELVTRYHNCTNMENSVYQRDLYSHFSLMDTAGVVITEGVVGTTYQDNSNDVDYIVENYLHFLTDIMIDEVRRRLH